MNELSELQIQTSLKLGIRAQTEGRFKDADRYFCDVLKKEPDNFEANYRLSLIAIKLGKIKVAASLLTVATRKNPHCEKCWVQLIGILMELGGSTDARGRLTVALEYFPDNKKLLGFQEQLNEQINDQEFTNTEGNSHINFDISMFEKKSLNQVLRQAQYLVKLGKLDHAILVFEYILKKYPKNNSARKNLKNLRRMQQNENTYGNDLNILIEDLLSLQRSGRHNEVIEIIDKIIVKFPNSYILYNIKGISLSNLNMLERALESYRNAENLNNKNALLYNNIGNLLIRMGDIDGSIVNYERATQLDNNLTNSVNNLISIYTQVPSKEKLFQYWCDKIIQSAINNKLNNPRVLIECAVGSFVKGNFSQVKRLVDMFNNLNQEDIRCLEKQDRQFCVMYAIFLSKLLSVNDFSQYRGKNSIYHMGESHCLSIAHHEVFIKGESFKISPLIILGAKCYHFSKSKNNEYKAFARSYFKSIPRNSKILISFGEIDCRIDEGIYVASEKIQRPLNTIIQETVQKYVNFFYEINKHQKHILHFVSVPAPVFDKRFSHDANYRLSNIIRLFNDNIQKSVEFYGYHFIDTYSHSICDSGFSNLKYHIDEKHFGPGIKEFIETSINLTS